VLDRIVQDKTEANLYRMEAACTSGLLYGLGLAPEYRVEAQSLYYQKCLAIATAEKSKKERGKKILADMGTPRGEVNFRLVGDVMDGIKQQASDNLEVLEQIDLDMVLLGQNVRLDGIESIPEVNGEVMEVVGADPQQAS
jgi:hypothetical protein